MCEDRRCEDRVARSRSAPIEPLTFFAQRSNHFLSLEARRGTLGIGLSETTPGWLRQVSPRVGIYITGPFRPGAGASHRSTGPVIFGEARGSLRHGSTFGRQGLSSTRQGWWSTNVITSVNRSVGEGYHELGMSKARLELSALW